MPMAEQPAYSTVLFEGAVRCPEGAGLTAHCTYGPVIPDTPNDREVQCFAICDLYAQSPPKLLPEPGLAALVFGSLLVAVLRRMRPVIVALVLFVSPLASPAVTSITYTSPARDIANAVSITFNFDADYTCGTYANGYDYYCVENAPGGGVTVNSYTPAYTAGRNGAMIDPPILVASAAAQQSYDDRDAGSWTPGLLVSVPVTVDAGESMVVAQSRPAGACGGSRGWVDGYAILTVVASAPAAGTFRPPYHAGKSGFPTFTTSDLDFSSVPTIDSGTYGTHTVTHEDVEALFDKPAANYNMYPTRGQHLSSCYVQGRGYSGYVSKHYGPYLTEILYDANDAAKQAAMIAITQHGLDILASVNAGTELNAGGGIGSYEDKTLAVFAATVLDDATLKSIVDNYSHETGGALGTRAWHQDQMTYIGDHGDALNGWPSTTNSERRDSFAEVDGRTGGSYWGIYRWGYLQHFNYALNWPEFKAADGGIDSGETESTFYQLMDRWYNTGQRCQPDVDAANRIGTNMEIDVGSAGICWFGHGYDIGFTGTANNPYITTIIRDTTDDTYSCAPNCDGGVTGSPDIQVRAGSPFSFAAIACGDATPAEADGTDWGDQNVDVLIGHATFLYNDGTEDLTVGTIGLSGDSQFEFTSTPTGQTLGPGEFQAFVITFTPTAVASYTATLSIASDDPDENPCTVALAGAGISTTAPDIRVTGNGQEIVSGDVTPTTDDDTDMGSVSIVTGTVQSTFTIHNDGDDDLNVTAIEFSGTDAANFADSGLSLAAVISAASSDTFDVDCDPDHVGVNSAIVTITNDDADEGTYTFALQCLGLGGSQEIEIRGYDENGESQVAIADGDTSPSTLDGTQFGDMGIYDAPLTELYEVVNVGSSDLSVTAASVSGSAFTLTSSVTYPATLATTESLVLTVSCAKTDIGTTTETVTVTSDDSDEATYTFSVSCTGVARVSTSSPPVADRATGARKGSK